ncbi:hypothetical protein Pan241w_22890 [Gimesia alba]|uniref:DUF4145 domain-containing protein n=1 Tax=Gimesia alba TaxID=2527973 RepID=A0A517REB0_9PLAN|nr:hypothetical protein [Gimesia alba]QDT42208.1 hypothetical protein Pan241w_22890 [Gimesia alba]
MNEVLEILVWPVTVIIVVVILRESLARLLLKTKKLKYKDLEVSFRESIEKIEAEAQEVSLNEPPRERKLESVEIDLYELASISPTVAVIEAWKSVESAARVLIQAKGHRLDYDTATPYKLIQDTLENENLLDERHCKIFNDLRLLRNKIVHAEGYTFSEEQARKYIDLSIRLRSYLNELSGNEAK